MQPFGAEPDGRASFSLVTSFLGLRAPDVLVKRDIAFDIVGGQLRLDRYAPPGASDGARPAIVVVHGGSWRSGYKGQRLTSTTESSRTFAARTPRSSTG